MLEQGPPPRVDCDRYAAFTMGEAGGNPAGVAIVDRLPDDATMQSVAAEIGYSETVFAMPIEGGYRVRYFSPEMEIPFCGHATIALGAALADAGVGGLVELELRNGSAKVEGFSEDGRLTATLHSAPTRHARAPAELLRPALALFDLGPDDLDERYPPAIIEAGARHLLLCLDDRKRLSSMSYDMATGAALMRSWELATISLVHGESETRFHARNPFAAGGVYEDPATGAAAAALVAYLHELEPGIDRIEVLQGEDMGTPCLIHACAPALRGGSARVGMSM